MNRRRTAANTQKNFVAGGVYVSLNFIKYLNFE